MTDSVKEAVEYATAQFNYDVACCTVNLPRKVLHTLITAAEEAEMLREHLRIESDECQRQCAEKEQLRARIASLEKDRPSLKELLAQITPENRHELLWDGEKDRPEVVSVGYLTAEHGSCGVWNCLNEIMRKFPNGIRIVQDKEGVE